MGNFYLKVCSRKVIVRFLVTVQRVVQLLLLVAKVIIPTGSYILTKTVCEGARAASCTMGVVWNVDPRLLMIVELCHEEKGS